MTAGPSLRDACRAGGAPRMWSRILSKTLPRTQALIPPGSRVLEVGYGDGLLTCWLAANFGWSIVGLDCSPKALEQARANIIRYALDRTIDLRLLKPEETWKFPGEFDAVFIKTVLYNAATPQQYGAWLDWVISVLKPRGVFINFENGKANRITYWYRKLRGRYYADLCMFDTSIEGLYRSRFPEATFRYYGALSQFISPIPLLFPALAYIEEHILHRTADNSYVASILARKG